MKKIIVLLIASALASITLAASVAIAADCSTTECACILVTYHDPAAPMGSDIVTDQFSWVKGPGQLNRRLGKWEAITVQFAYESNGVQACCSVIDNDQAQEPWTAFALSHFAPLNGDRRELHWLLYAQTPEYAEFETVTQGDISNATEIPAHTVIDNSLIDNLLITADSRLIPLSDDQALIDLARAEFPANRISLLNGC